jgi:2-aminoadipate transaminase
MTIGSPFRLARRAAKMNPSAIREILKLTERPGVISFAGGLPSPKTFPVDAMRVACDRVLRDTPREALQYAASEGFGPLRDWVAGDLLKQGLRTGAGQLLMITGSQQGLDLLAKVLNDEGSTVIVESPTYLGAVRLSFVTASVEQIEAGVVALGEVVRAARECLP